MSVKDIPLGPSEGSASYALAQMDYECILRQRAEAAAAYQEKMLGLADAFSEAARRHGERIRGVAKDPHNENLRTTESFVLWYLMREGDAGAARQVACGEQPLFVPQVSQ